MLHYTLAQLWHKFCTCSSCSKCLRLPYHFGASLFVRYNTWRASIKAGLEKWVNCWTDVVATAKIMFLALGTFVYFFSQGAVKQRSLSLFLYHLQCYGTQLKVFSVFSKDLFDTKNIRVLSRVKWGSRSADWATAWVINGDNYSLDRYDLMPKTFKRNLITVTCRSALINVSFIEWECWWRSPARRVCQKLWTSCYEVESFGRRSVRIYKD